MFRHLPSAVSCVVPFSQITPLSFAKSVHKLSSFTMAKVGGAGGVKVADDDANNALKAVRDDIDKQLNTKGFNAEVVHYKTQVVAGTNLFLKIKFEDDKKNVTYAFARVFRDFGGKHSLHSVKGGQDANTEVAYF
uniref:Cystatin domain-containing protein n=1 Tax=Coccolithus braarudii TaxID=221442 RepID=A0A7S0LIZ2_9EUKA